MGVVLLASVVIPMTIYFILGYNAEFSLCGDAGAVDMVAYPIMFSFGIPIFGPMILTATVTLLVQKYTRYSAGTNFGWLIALALIVLAGVGFIRFEHHSYPTQAETDQECIQGINV